MEGKTAKSVTLLNEKEMLAAIVDAMLDAENELQIASEENWTKILVSSCRKRKSHSMLVCSGTA